MKTKYFFWISLLIFISKINAQTNNVGIGTINPDNSAVLDLTSTSKGLLIPRISLTGTSDTSTISNPAQSLFIYNTASVADVLPGFYYWNVDKWVKITGEADMPNEITTLTSVNPQLPLTGHVIGTYINENNVSTNIIETVTKLNILGNGKYQYNDENGSIVTLDIYADIINNPDFTNYITSIVQNNPETVTTVTPVVTSGNVIATYKNEDSVDVDIKETQTSLLYDSVNKKLVYNGEGTAPTEILLSSVFGDNETKYTAGTGINLSATNEFSAKINDPIWNASLLQGNSISATIPLTNQVLKFDGINWTPATLIDNIPYTAGANIDITGNVISATDTQYTADETTINLAGTVFSVPNSTAQWNANLLQGTAISTTAPTASQALIYDGINWIPTSLTDNNTTYTNGTGLNLTGTVFSAQNTNAIWNANQLQTQPISTTTPTDGQALVYNSIAGVWEPQDQQNATYSADETTLTISAGNQFSALNTVAQWNANQLQTIPVNSTIPVLNQALIFNGTSWAPETLIDNNTTYTALSPGISLTGTEFSVPNTTAIWNSNLLQSTAVSSTAPTANQALVYDGSSWVPTTIIDNNDIYSNGTGLDLTGNVFSAQTTNPIWNASQLQTQPISATMPTNDQALVYNSTTSQWEPQDQQNATYSADETTITKSAGDQFSALNTTAQWNASQLQSKPISATAPTTNQALIYNGATWTATTLIDNNTTYSADETTITKSAGDQFSALNTTAQWNASQLQSKPISATAPTTNQALVYNGATWTATTLTDNNTTYSATSPGITLTGTVFSVPNTTAQWNANLLQGTVISTTAPTSSQALIYDGTTWIPTTLIDNNTTYTATAPGITLTGTAFSVPNTTAQWNASELQTHQISATTPTDGQALVYNGTTAVWEPQNQQNSTYSADGTTLIKSAGNQFSALNTTAQWNSNQLQSHTISAVTPANGQALVYNSTTSVWEPQDQQNATYSADETTITKSAGNQFSALNTAAL